MVSKEVKYQKLLNILLDIVLNSATAYKPVTFIEKNRKYSTRSQLHMLVVSNFGTSKSTIIEALPDKSYIENTEYTLPALCGTITRDGEFQTPFLNQVAGKMLVLDESQNLERSAYLALLSIIEKQKHSRSLGFKLRHKLPRNKETRSKYHDIKINGGKIDIKYKFSCLSLGTNMPFEYDKIQNQVRNAFLSRWIVFKTRHNFHDAMAIVRGEKTMDLKMWKKPYKGGIEIPYKVYNKLTKVNGIYEKMVLENPILKKQFSGDMSGYCTRNINDICRIAAYFAGKRGNIQVDDEDMTNAQVFIKPILYNYIEGTLIDQTDQIILDNYTNFTQSELQDITRLDQSTISRRIEKLKKQSLIVNDVPAIFA